MTYDAEPVLADKPENRLVGVSGAASVSFTYDGDGKLVKRVVNNQQTTVYVGDLYQKNTGTGQVTKYYYLGDRRVAVRIGGTAYWLLVDHLGSTMVVLDGSGSKVGEKWYYSFGEERYTSGSLFVERRFTGQRWDGTIGLYDYQARFYDPALGRFLQPDPIVPEPGNPQALNRYAYVNWTPMGTEAIRGITRRWLMGRRGNGPFPIEATMGQPPLRDPLNPHRSPARVSTQSPPCEPLPPDPRSHIRPTADASGEARRPAVN